jgi:Tfp pilus assembly protein PilE
MNKQRVRAFTILEVTITMLITALLIGITYTSYSIVIKSYRSFTTKNDDMAVVVSLDHLLKRDFERADTILKDTDGIVLKSEDKVIKYAFKPDFIVRTSARIDTFKVDAQEVNTTFENMPVNELQATEEQNRINQLDFILVFQNVKIPYHYHKLYSSENLIQRNPNAIN